MEDQPPPVFIKRASTRTKSRPHRSRPVEAGSPPPAETKDDDVQQEDSPMTLATKLKAKNKTRPAKPQAKLSFGAADLEESQGEVFQVKKSQLSRRIKLGAAPANLVSTDDQSASSSSTPMYSKEYLSELKASTSKPPTRPHAEDAATPDVEMSMDLDTIIDADDNGITQASLATTIHTTSAITAAREKRERARKLRSLNPNAGADASEDFISLSITKRGTGDVESLGPHPDSRLVREEDEEGEGDDDMAEYTGAKERIALGKKSRKEAERKRRAGIIELIDDVEEDDEETKEWEMAQIRRGGTVKEIAADELQEKRQYRPASIPAETPLPSLGAAISQLNAKLTNLTVSHASHTAALTTLGGERESLESKEKEMREMVEKTVAKKDWFSELRERIESVANFLDDKFPVLEKIEEDYIGILKERYQMISERRRSDNEDDLSLFLRVPPALASEPEQVDDLGRVVPSAQSSTSNSAVRRSRRADRELRRSARASAKPLPPSQALVREEGYSTDSELPSSELRDFQLALSSLRERLVDMMADVRATEFKDPKSGIGTWFGEWREKWPESYVGAWGGLACIGAWEFWVRLETAGWNPFEDDRSLDSFAWYSALYEYSRPRTRPVSAMDVDDQDDMEPELGLDGDLVSAMITTAIVPQLCKLIEGGALDPFSAKHIRKLVDIAEQIEVTVEKDHLKLQNLLKAVIQTFRTAVSESATALQPWLSSSLPPAFDPASIPARRRYLTRQLKLLANLVRWRKHTGDRFGAGELLQRLVEEVMLPVARSGWDVGGQEIMQKAVKALPAEHVPRHLVV
ncbi:hypothetical protein BOTBODRAFT_36752 [Botryobasidium botryosum FD-172 SS1]|uniref:GCF C-terminal domain-containing protein n=1 Tax=Botryobasidium botryosum (strain FD-172 SS1) TaxID=930990 RepID=A0A067M5G8_BOTB1|nr:hypothetical protein BOTBODRAFT_36752 [Botryobasidium botryosum FD-172 SS1]